MVSGRENFAFVLRICGSEGRLTELVVNVFIVRFIEVYRMIYFGKLGLVVVVE